MNINEEVGSTAPKAMAETVRTYRADIGIALDGDADRVVICDEKGQTVDGDQIMALIADHWSKAGTLQGGGVVATVMSNLGLERFLQERGLTLERTRVGDRYVMERMRSGGFNIGGEQSGHIILSDHSTTGDGLIAALQVLTVLVETGKPMSALRLVWNQDCTHNLTAYLTQKLRPALPGKSVKPVAVVVKPCDSRAINVLMAENRMQRELVHVIGVQCDGIRQGAGMEPLNEGMLQARCLACNVHTPIIYDSLVGKDPSRSRDNSRGQSGTALSST